jgi:hypothetical protein
MRLTISESSTTEYNTVFYQTNTTMKVIKAESSSVSYVNGAAGRLSATYHAVDSDGNIAASFRPGDVRGGRVFRDANGKIQRTSPIFTLKQFREWAAANTTTNS